ncbi:MAG: hypothetical protein GY898_13455 [Proteobacteria bacterium]|nr:hypothetical protein [Pseudomonadota bacterium]
MRPTPSLRLWWILLLLGCGAETPPPADSVGWAAYAAPSPSWELFAAQGDSSLGVSVASAGDVNGDGRPDVLLGVPGYDSSATSEGAAALFLGTFAGFSTTPALLLEGGQPYAFEGTAVAGLGDIDVDGFDDFAIGAPGWDAPDGSDLGRLRVYAGSATGLDPNPIFEVVGDIPHGGLGRSIAALPDADGDGRPELAVGQPGRMHPDAPELGTVLVWDSTLGPLPVFKSTDPQAGSGYGWSLASAGDQNGDGVPDLAVGAPLWVGLGGPTGRVEVLFGLPGGVGSIGQLTIPGVLPQERAGAALAGGGDVDGDGLLDLVVGSPGWSGDDVGEGRIEAYAGDGGAPLFPPGTLAGGAPGAQLGASIAWLGDLDGDGRPELGVGAPTANDSSADEGAVLVFTMPLGIPWVATTLRGDDPGGRHRRFGRVHAG